MALCRHSCTARCSSRWLPYTGGSWSWWSSIRTLTPRARVSGTSSVHTAFNISGMSTRSSPIRASSPNTSTRSISRVRRSERCCTPSARPRGSDAASWARAMTACMGGTISLRSSCMIWGRLSRSGKAGSPPEPLPVPSEVSTGVISITARFRHRARRECAVQFRDALVGVHLHPQGHRFVDLELDHLAHLLADPGVAGQHQGRPGRQAPRGLVGEHPTCPSGPNSTMGLPIMSSRASSGWEPEAVDMGCRPGAPTATRPPFCPLYRRHRRRLESIPSPRRDELHGFRAPAPPTSPVPRRHCLAAIPESPARGG